MEKAFSVQLVSFIPILKSAGIKFKEDEKTLTVGKPSANSGFVILVSCRTLDTAKLLRELLPILRNSKAAYRIIKSQHEQYRLNGGAFGEEEAGKAVTIFPVDLAQAAMLVERLSQMEGQYKGPIIMNAQQIGKITYVQKVTKNATGELILSYPDLQHFPFSIPKAFRRKKSSIGLIGNWYLPVELLRTAAKGNIYKAINLKRFAFDWCLIKQGKPGALDDHFDRDMKDRLQWQKEVHEALKDKVYTPQVIDFFSHHEHNYLVFNYAEGNTLGNIVREKLAGNQWTAIDNATQIDLLNYFLQAAKIVCSIHQEDFVHRDITDSNFILSDEGKLCIIDFELSYSLSKGLPDPPFLLGTYGYVAPEQIEHAVPHQKEDIYSLGALLCFILTACKTWEFITPNVQRLRTKLMRLTNERELTELVLKCLSKTREARPEITEVIDIAGKRLFTIMTAKNEKITMAV